MIWLSFLFFIPFGFSIFMQRKLVKTFIKHNKPYSRSINGLRACTELLTFANIHSVKVSKRKDNLSFILSTYENKKITISNFVYENSTISCLATVSRLVVYAAMDKKGHKLFSKFKKYMPFFNFLLILGLSFLFFGIIFYTLGFINVGIALFGIFLYYLYFFYLVYFLKLEKIVVNKSYELLIKSGYIKDSEENVLPVLNAYKFFYLAEIAIFLAMYFSYLKALIINIKSKL